MPGKSKKGSGPPADAFDDIIADAQQLNAIIDTTNTTTTNTTSSSSSSSSSSSKHEVPSEEEADAVTIRLCVAGDLVRLRQHLSCGGTVIGARALLSAVIEDRLDVVRILVKEYGANVSEMSDGMFPLIAAATQGFLNMMRCLVNELGADVDQDF
jgi:hypothetical protein